jgi:uncharacterized membrane protein
LQERIVLNLVQHLFTGLKKKKKKKLIPIESEELNMKTTHLHSDSIEKVRRPNLKWGVGWRTRFWTQIIKSALKKKKLDSKKKQELHKKKLFKRRNL